MSRSWLRQPERGSYLALRLITWIATRFGRRLSRVLLYPICAYFVAFDPRGSRASRAYLARALGRPPALGDVFRQFTQPGFIDTLRGDYESLYRTKERGDFEGTGGTIPAFEDFIKTRISGDYRSFLETEKPKLQQAFELAAPEERGQRDRGAIAPPKRIL